jgi:hypothetical protein
MCGQAMFQQLNYWYGQQANLVNNYYMQLASQCSSGAAAPVPQTPGDRITPGDVTLNVDDKDRTVRIKIPSTPQGFVPQ